MCVPNFEFLASTVLEIPKLGHVTHGDPYWPNFSFFPLVPLGAHVRAKFRKFWVSSFYRSWDTEGVPKFQNWVTWPPGDPYWPNFSFFPLVLLGVHLRAKFRVSSYYHSRDTRGSHNSKITRHSGSSRWRWYYDENNPSVLPLSLNSYYNGVDLSLIHIWRCRRRG